MFSFLSKSTPKDSGSEKPSVSSSSAGSFTPPVTNSSHEGNSLFGGMDLSSDVAVEPVEDSSVSGFSFMQSSEPEPVEEVSSFSFLNTSEPEVDVVQPAPAPQPDKTLDLLSSPIKAAEPPQNLKMAKASAPKVVKKKKRTSRVGLGREDDGDDDDQPASTQGLVHSHSMPSVSEATHEGDNSDGESEAHVTVSVPIVGQTESEVGGSSAFDFLVETTAGPSVVVDDAPAAVSHTGTRPSLLSFSMPEEKPAPSSVGGAMSLADFDGMMVHSEPAPVVVVAAKPVVVSPPIVSTPPPAKPVVVAPVAVAVAVVQEVKKEPVSTTKTTQEQSVVKLNKFYDSVVSMSQVHSNFVLESKRIRAQIESESNNLVLLKGQLTSLENEQAKHAADEEFDKADMMTGPIEQTKEDILKKGALIESLQSQAVDLEVSFASQRQQIVSVVQLTFSDLTTIKDQLIVEAAELESTQVEGNEIEEIRIRVEEERISLEKSHFEKEESALAEELRITEDAIKSQSGAVQQKKEDIEINLLSVQSEIKLLEQQLASKKNEESQLLKELNLVDSKITEVRKKYERQLQRIQDRSYALAETKRECLAEEAALRQEKEQYARAAQESLDKRESFVGWTRSVRDDLQVMDLFVRNTERAEEHFKLLINSSSASVGASSNSDGKSAVLQVAQSEALNALNQATTAEVQMRQEIEDLTVEARAIVEQIPKLELEKKSHAASKRFKEAASVAKDIKDGQSRKEEIDLKIDQLSASVATQAEEVERTKEAYRLASQAVKDVQKEVDIQRCRSLLERARELRSLLKKIAKVKPAQQQQGYKQTPSVSDVSSRVTAYFTAELSDVMEEAHNIKQNHQPSDEMFAVSEADDNEDEQEAEVNASQEEEEGAKEALISESAAEESTSEVVEEVIDDLVNNSITEEVAAEVISGDDAVINGAAVDEVAEESVESADLDVEVDLSALKEMKARIASLNESLSAATESEDYEQAASLDEEITALTTELESKLTAAGITEDAL